MYQCEICREDRRRGASLDSSETSFWYLNLCEVEKVEMCFM